MKVFYPLWLWLMTIGIATILIDVYGLFTEHEIDSMMILSIYYILYGLFFSLPVFAITYIVFFVLRELNLRYFTVKLWLAIVAIIGVIVTLYLLDPSLVSEYSFFYILSLIIASRVLRIKKKTVLIKENEL